MISSYRIQNFLASEWQEWKRAFAVSLLINILTYGLCIFHITYAVDDYSHIFDQINVLANGRWVVNFFHNIVFQTSFMPVLAPVLCILCNILTGIGICKLWSIKGTTSLIVIILWSCHPYLLDIYNFRIIALPFSIGYLLGIIALHLAIQTKTKLMLSILLLYIALSTYQPILGVLIAVFMVQLFLITAREDFSVQSINKTKKLFVRYCLVIGLSVIVYILITKQINTAFDVGVNSRIRMGFISNFEELKAKLCVVGAILLVRLGPIKEFILPFAGKLVIFVISLLAMWEIIQKKIPLLKRLLALVWICLTPLGAISFVLILETLAMPWRICLGFVIFGAGLFVICQESNSPFVRKTSFYLGIFLVIYFIANNNTQLYKQILTNQRDFVTGTRILAKIQSLDEYKPGMELVIINHISQKKFSREGKDEFEIFREYIKHCSTRQYSLATSALATEWSKYPFFLEYLELELKQVSQYNFQKALKAAKDVEPWPDQSSVFIVDDVVVVKLEDFTE